MQTLVFPATEVSLYKYGLRNKEHKSQKHFVGYFIYITAN